MKKGIILSFLYATTFLSLLPMKKPDDQAQLEKPSRVVSAPPVSNSYDGREGRRNGSGAESPLVSSRPRLTIKHGYEIYEGTVWIEEPGRPRQTVKVYVGRKFASQDDLFCKIGEQKMSVGQFVEIIKEKRNLNPKLTDGFLQILRDWGVIN